MIKKISLNNFQNHQKTELLFSDGVNILTGASDSGKSAIIRALRWVLFNKPRGNEFISYWADECTVTIELNDGNVVSKKRNKQTTEYYLNDQVFKAFGNEIPDEIQKVLNIDEINLQIQSAQPFLLQSSSGEVASHFNNMANLSIIDSALDNINSAIKSSNKDLDYHQRKANEIKDKYRELRYLSQVTPIIEQLQEYEQLTTAKQSKLTGLYQMQRSINNINTQILAVSSIVRAENMVDDIITHFKKMHALELRKLSLLDISNKHAGISAAINSIKLDINSEPIINDLLQLTQSSKNINNKLTNLKNILNKVKLLQRQIIEENKNIESMTLQLPKTCPLCGK